MRLPGIRYGTGAENVKSVNVVGRGRVGSAIAARLTERGVELREEGAGLVLLCVPDRELAGVAPSLRLGLGRACERRHTAVGSRPARAPLRSATRCKRSRARGAEQLDGAYAAVSAEGPRSARCRFRAGPNSGAPALRARDSLRALYHAGAAVASNFLVTLFRAAAELVERPVRPLKRCCRSCAARSRTASTDGADRTRRLGRPWRPTWRRSANPIPSWSRCTAHSPI